MKSLALAAVALALLAPAVRAQDIPPDPYQWLEDVEAPRSMAWVEKENAKSAARLEGDRRYPVFLREARAILTAQDRIPTPRFRAGGVDNLWQEAGHVHGLWRHTTLAGYRTAAPRWQTLIDLDALSK